MQWLKYVRSTILLALGIFLLTGAGQWFQLEGWQRYGMGGILVIYSLWRLWQQVRQGRS